MGQILAALRGEPVRLPEPPTGPLGRLPLLVTARWCPFTMPADRLWSGAAREAGIELRLVDPETEEGEMIVATDRIAGVPCLVSAPGRHHYGTRYSAQETRSILEAARS